MSKILSTLIANIKFMNAFDYINHEISFTYYGDGNELQIRCLRACASK